MWRKLRRRFDFQLIGRLLLAWPFLVIGAVGVKIAVLIGGESVANSYAEALVKEQCDREWKRAYRPIPKTQGNSRTGRETIKQNQAKTGRDASGLAWSASQLEAVRGSTREEALVST